MGVSDVVHSPRPRSPAGSYVYRTRVPSGAMIVAVVPEGRSAGFSGAIGSRVTQPSSVLELSTVFVNETTGGSPSEKGTDLLVKSSLVPVGPTASGAPSGPFNKSEITSGVSSTTMASPPPSVLSPLLSSLGSSGFVGSSRSSGSLSSLVNSSLMPVLTRSEGSLI